MSTQREQRLRRAAVRRRIARLVAIRQAQRAVSWRR